MQKRIVYLDHLKVFLTGLVLAHHQLIAFSGAGSWFYIVAQPNESTFQVVFAHVVATLNQSFLMSLFFFISAFFLLGSLRRHGAFAFAKQRLIRLGVPLLVFYLIFSPLLTYWSTWLKNGLGEWHLRIGPLWFVAALLLFSLAFLLKWIFFNGASSVRRPLPSDRVIVGLCLLLGLMQFGVRLIFPIGENLGWFLPSYFTLYIAFFIGGILAARHNWLDELLDRPLQQWSFMAILSSIFLISYVYYVTDSSLIARVMGGFNFHAFALAMWEPFSCFSIILLLLKGFAQLSAFTSPLSQKLSNAAYGAYIFQPFFIIPATALVAKLSLPSSLSFLLGCSLSIPSAFIFCHYIRKLPYFDRIL